MSAGLRIGFVGLGGIARSRHIPALRAIEGVTLAAVANRRPDSTAAAAAEFEIPRTFDDWRELVTWDGIDIVWCATWPNLHRDVTEAALEAGKHVFCQARMATTYADAQAMLVAAERSDRTTILCSYSGYLRGDGTVRRLLREGWIGRPTGIVLTSMSARYADPGAPIHWRQRRQTFGRNILDLGQLVEVQQRWFGPARRVTALAATITGSRPSRGNGEPVPVDRPDIVTAVATLENGALATYVLSGVAHGAEERDSIELFGDAGTIRYESSGDRILAGRRGEPELQPVEIRPEDEPTETVERRFIDAIRAGRTLAGPPSFRDGVRYMEVVEAIDRALESRVTVDLPL